MRPGGRGTGGIGEDEALMRAALPGAAGLDLEDRREARFEPPPRGAQVQPPDAQALGAGQAQRLVAVLVQPCGPAAPRLGVGVAKALGVLRLEARALER